ncbi:MAG TPA: polyphosphate polymerase domain-containing protein [Vicinamibacterales bacterium]
MIGQLDQARTGTGQVHDAVEHELKFTVPVSSTAAVLAWLRGACTPDPRFPCGRVSSIYYDTPDFRSLREKLNSDYLKTKVRLRWYATLAGESTGHAMLESKRRIGAQREKVRLETELPGARVAGMPLDDPRLAELPRRLWAVGVMAPAMRPVLTVQYDRYRFVDRASGTRVSLDVAISCPATSRRVTIAPNPRPLDVSVLEVKGPTSTLPASLQPLTGLGARRASFSKYFACFRHVTREQA